MPGPLSSAASRLLADAASELLLTQTEISRRSGVSQSKVSRTFSGSREFTLDELDAVCHALGLSLLAVIDEAKREAAGDAGRV